MSYCVFISHRTLTTTPLWKDFITRILIIRFRPKKRYQTVEMMKWLDCNNNWVAPTLSWNLQKFIVSFFGNLFISKNVSLKNSLHISHKTLNNIRCLCDNISSLEYWSSYCVSTSHRTLTTKPLWKNIITRILVKKFRPKTRCQTVGLMKWLDRKGNWVVPSLSYNLQKFISSTLKICSFRKKFPSLCLCHAERSIKLYVRVVRYHH